MNVVRPVVGRDRPEPWPKRGPFEQSENHPETKNGTSEKAEKDPVTKNGTGQLSMENSKDAGSRGASLNCCRMDLLRNPRYRAAPIWQALT